AWAYADSRPLNASIAKNWGGGIGGFQIGLHENQGDLEMKIGEADGDFVTAREGYDDRFPLASWQHVALVTDGSLARLYRNGVEVACAQYDGALKTNRKGLGVGMRPNNAGTKPNNLEPAYWDGRIDDVRIYGRALGQNEIAALHEVGITTVVEGGGAPPRFVRLEPNAPNPFNPVTRIEYALPRSARVDLSIYDLGGRLVRTLVRSEQAGGRYSVSWRGKNESGRDVASGVYFYRLDVNGEASVRKMMLVR
ncbi:MAG: T9SS type A sorting domain-containing protein, partial [Gemmatimonadetes bacterium]|nr:T9SS type A sorting domain-containing protein [Gemmatimonadota bacterium]